jgi:hypothetical protein
MESPSFSQCGLVNAFLAAPHKIMPLGFPGSPFLSQEMRGETMADRVSKLPRGKKKIPIDVVRARLQNHLELVLASNNEVLIRMMEQFFSEMIDRAVQERPKAEVIPINREDKKW